MMTEPDEEPGPLDICVDRLETGFSLKEARAELAAVDRRDGAEPEAAAYSLALWEPGQVLRVRFLDGTLKMRASVEAVARTWEDHASIRFQFVERGVSDVRITFVATDVRGQPDGYYSQLGTFAQRVAEDAHTMSLSNRWDDDWIDRHEVVLRRTVLHEFGHALGLVHEHSSPRARIPWDRPKVYAYYGRTQGWSREEVDAQVLVRYQGGDFPATPYDPKSIMQYPVDASLTRGGYSVPWNNELSETDKQFIARLYPPRA